MDEERIEEKEEEIEGFEGVSAETVREVMEEEGLEIEETESESTSEPESAPSQEIPQQQTMPEQAPIEPFKITEEMAKTMEEAILVGAKSISGFSDDDIDELDYLEEDDPKRLQWETAKKLASDKVHNYVQGMHEQRQQQANMFFQEHNAAVKDFQDYTAAAMKEPDYQRAQAYATGEYFNKQSPQVQLTIARSYDRVLRGMASPQDYLVVKNYYENAKREIGGSVRTKFPRSSRLNGVTSGANRSYSEREIESMIDAGEWDQVPQEFINRALNSPMAIRRN